MKNLRRLSVILLLVSSLFMTGCDTTQIVEVIGKIAEGVQQAMPAISNIVNTFANIFGNDNDNNNAENNQQQAAAQAADEDTTAGANVATIDPNQENIGNDPGQGTAAANQQNQPEDIEELIEGARSTQPYDQVGTESSLAEAAAVKAKYGITLLNGKQWKNEWESALPANWTSQQTAELAAVLAKMPAGFRKCTSGFSLQQNITDNENGSDIGGIGGDPIILSAKTLAEGGPAALAELAAHEMTHQFQAKNPDVARLWAGKFWPNGKQVSSSITDYGNTNSLEDMAECVSKFFSDPVALQKHDPARYEFVKNNIWK